MTYTEEDERTARVENLMADTDYKQGLAKYEPWKVVMTAFGAGAAVTLALLTLATFILAHLK